MTSLAQAIFDVGETYRDLEAALEGDSWPLIAFAFTEWQNAKDRYRAFLLPQDQT